MPAPKDLIKYQEWKRKISEARKGKTSNTKGKHWKLSEEAKRKISEAMKGIKRKPFSEETKRKLRENHKGMLGKKHSEKTRKKLSERKQGGKNWNWKGGISFEPYPTDWTETLKRAIRERDNYICQLCSQYGNSCHHIDYNKKNCNPDNLITLCVSCHAKVNKNRDYWIDYFRRTIKKRSVLLKSANKNR